MEIFRLLDRSNCRKCNELTCLAFSTKVFKGKRSLDECPKLPANVIDKYGDNTSKQPSIQDNLANMVEELRLRVSELDFVSAAERVGGKTSGASLTIKILGKDFSVDSEGKLYSDIHVHPWVTMPILSYLIDCKGMPPTGNWVPFRELKTGRIWYQLFEQRCEKPLKRIADTYTNLFEDMIHIFNGKQVENHYSSDISLVLHPLPKVPILVSYWKPEDGLESDLTIFFDSTAEEQLSIEAIFGLGTGLVQMFEKIALRHGLRE
jgi:hypothetical protein